MPVAPSRRSLLIGGFALTSGGIALGLQGCSGGASDSATDESRAPSDGAPADQDVRALCVEFEVALIAAYDAALGSGPNALLSSIREQHLAHLTELGGSTAASPSASSTSLPAPSTTDLQERERVSARAVRSACSEALDPELIRTLTFIAASEASHVPALGGLT